MRIKALAGSLLVIPGLVLALIIGLGGAGQTASALATGCGPASGAGATPLDAEQRATAATIAAVGRAMGVPARGQVVAVAAALQESGLRNLPYGDRDSLGVFQQRAGWGPVAARMNPATAASAFYAHLAAVPGWQVMTVTAAAQAVQRSAYPGAYARWEGQAAALVSGQPAACGAVVVAGTPGSPAVGTGEGGLRPQTVAARRAVLAVFGPMTVYGIGERGRVSDHPLGLAVDFMTNTDRAKGSRLAAWVVAHAAQLRVKYVIYSRHIWSAARSAEGWRLMPDRGSPTENHEDHVHVSLLG